MQLQPCRLEALSDSAGYVYLRVTIVSAGLVALLLQSAGAFAQARCAQPAARAASVEGRVEVRADPQAAWRPVHTDDALCAGDAVRVLELSRAGLLLANDVLLRLDQNSVLTLGEAEPEKPSVMELLRGWLHVITRHRKQFRVTTPVVNAVVDGTEFTVSTGPGESSVTVNEGRVRMQSQGGALALESGQAAVVRGTGAPQPFVSVRPLDAVQWALYFPPVLRYRPGLLLEQEAAKLALEGDATGALERVGQIPPAARSESLRAFEASLLLSVGRVDEAAAILKARLAGADPDALALDAILQLIIGDRGQAAARAEAAVRARPTAATLLAQSYVRQSEFRLEDALQNAQRATQIEPDNAIAWARLSELELSTGDSARARRAAERALELSPSFGRGHTMLGFVLLAQGEIKQAQQSFDTAAARLPGDPLPRLGKGLALIRTGKLVEGRRELELAVLLDPGNSLLRSYLGKAYYDEKRDELAGTQFDLARGLDPKDPTPWFYDAIRKLNQNRPGEAIEDLQRSMALNENRAPYRSRLLLDQDQATRLDSLARIYGEVGFDQLALSEGATAASQAPANFSAHRFLADAYAPLPRYESARVSELLQSQLLQPANAVPVSPRMGQTRAPFLESEGPITPSFQEFNPLFGRNRQSGFVSGVAGGNNTLGDELMYALVDDNQAMRLGQFHYQTDGWRQNSDFKQDIYSAFYQNDLAWHTSVQAEYRNSATSNGDLRQRLDQEQFSTSLRQSDEFDTLRLGLRHSENAAAHWLVSLTREKVEKREQGSQFLAPDPVAGTPRLDTDSEGHATGFTGELQHLRQMRLANLIAGAGASDISKQLRFSSTLSFSGGLIPLPPLTAASDQDASQRHENGYVYLGWALAQGATLTTGLSYDHYVDEAVFSRHQWNPKLGLLWDITSRTRLRFAAFRTLKRPFAANQMLEPTQVAGINQLFDDVDGTDAKGYGIGLDWKLQERWFLGAEGGTRDLDVPISQLGGGLARIEPRTETRFRAYLSGLATPRLSLSAEYLYEDQEREPAIADGFARRVVSEVLPLRATYHHPNGVFGMLRLTYVKQSAELLTGSGTTAEDSTRFPLVDLSLGYRLPGRHGLISLDVRNLFDRRFGFEDTDFSGNPRVPVFQSGRSVFLRFTFYP
jgi:tetratricopeptide (TPR) repeat protein